MPLWCWAAINSARGLIKGRAAGEAGYAPIVFVSGPPNLVRYESTDEVQFAEQKGYPAALFREVHLTTPAAAESTRTEAQFIGHYLAAQGVNSILLVTSLYHTKRAAKLWRKENPAAERDRGGRPRSLLHAGHLVENPNWPKDISLRMDEDHFGDVGSVRC